MAFPTFGGHSPHYDVDDLFNSFSSCEHYSRTGNRDHYKQFHNDSYDVDYLEAHFFKDMTVLNQIEATAVLDGYGPLSACTTITNFSAQRVFCREFFPYDLLLSLI